MTTQVSVSSIYGPIPSWRVGKSLGVDLICGPSTCSFNCIYCQLGSILHVNQKRKIFIATEKVLEDFESSDWQEADIITYSGSGEPTLAENLGEVIREIGVRTSTPQLVLTNGTLLGLPGVVSDLQAAERVYIKLDAGTEEIYQIVNRPVEGITLKETVENIKRFREEYMGYLGIQVMFMANNLMDVDAICGILNDIQPDEVQLNTPTRPYPKNWHISSRGGHTPELREYESQTLRTINQEQAEEIESIIRKKTKLRVLSVYKPDKM